MGDLLRIDLTTRTSSEETVPPQLIKELIGAKGIGTHYLCEEVGPEVDPLSPGAKLIFVSGPMGGTSMLGSNRYALYSRIAPHERVLRVLLGREPCSAVSRELATKS